MGVRIYRFVVICILAAILGKCYQIEKVAFKAHLFPEAQVSIKMSDVSWDKLPPLTKETISKQSLGTKLSKEDLQRLSETYKSLADNYTEPISLKGIFK